MKNAQRPGAFSDFNLLSYFLNFSRFLIQKLIFINYLVISQIFYLIWFFIAEILFEAEYLSVDPYMRPYTVNFPIGSDMIGCQIAKIVESKNEKFPVGKRIRGYYGWRTHTIINPDKWDPPGFLKEKPSLLPDFGDLSPSLGLGGLGMPG